jgi:hypothetical protein
MVCTRQPWSHYVRIFHRNDVLNLFAQVTAFRFFALSRTAKTVKEQPASTLFLRIYNRRWPRVSAENEMSLADILPQREQREQRKRIEPMRSRWHPCISWRCVIQLSAMRDHLFGEQSHRVLDHGVVHDPALIEIANELVHPVFTME